MCFKQIRFGFSVCLLSVLIWLIGTSCRTIKESGQQSEMSSIEFTDPGIEKVDGAKLEAKPSEPNGKDSDCTKNVTANFKTKENSGAKLTLERKCFDYNFALTFTCDGKDCYTGTKSNVPFSASQNGSLIVKIDMTPVNGGSTFTAESENTTNATITGELTQYAPALDESCVFKGVNGADNELRIYLCPDKDNWYADSWANSSTGTAYKCDKLDQPFNYTAQCSWEPGTATDVLVKGNIYIHCREEKLYRCTKKEG